MKSFKIPEATVVRLSLYARQLRYLRDDGVETVSSDEIATSVGVSSAQVRKDLNYFGEFGTRGVGYKVDDLLGYLTKILGLDKEWNIVIVGAGKLGSALALYQGFGNRGYSIKAILDADHSKVGEILGNVTIEPLELLEARVKEYGVKMGIITVPAEAAQQVADLLVKSGVSAILNFSPRVLRVPPDIILRNVDMSVNLQILSFNLSINQ